ncbi:MAG: hypothetical protein ACE5RF_06430 [Nitrosarchaeum sp.]
MSDIESKFTEIEFLAEKVHAHYWPLDTPKWSDIISEQVSQDLNKNKDRKKIIIKSNVVLIDNYRFMSLKKIGLTIPLFKKECTMVFEGCFQNFYAHVHITTKEKRYLEIFNRLMQWRSIYFSDSLLS